MLSHSHGHSHEHDRSKIGVRVTIVGAVVDLVLAVIKMIAGIIGNSGALIADSVHSFSDLVSDGLVLFAAKRADDPPDEEHPYGHERFETVATVLLSAFLFFVGLEIILEAVNRVLAPEPSTHTALLIGVISASILSKEVIYWYTMNAAKKTNSKLLEANAWHSRSDAMSSVVVFVAIVGTAYGYPILDGIASIVVGLMIIYIAYGLGLGASKELVDTSIESKKITEIRHAIGQISGVNNLHSLRTRKNGQKIYCDVHVQVDPFLSVSEGHIISVSVERVTQKCLNNKADITVHIDPEDDEISAPYEDLPERAEALGILNKALFNNKCDGEIKRIQLHYLDGKIHVDFFLPLSCLSSDKSYDEILDKLTEVVRELPGFGDIKVYFG
jgi:cation diffusion facilitator family transporter